VCKTPAPVVLRSVKLRNAVVVGVAFAALAPVAAEAGVPRDVSLPIPAAPYVRVMPGCVWGTHARTLSITRRVDQAFNVVNLGSQPHRIVQLKGAAGPLASWHLGRHQAVALLWRVPTTVVLTTCSGKMKLTVRVFKP
jgi:hypothetical protein